MSKVITVEELEQSRNYHIKMAQRSSFPEEYECLLNKQQLSAKSSLLKLNLTINKGLFTLRSRLNNALSYPEQIRNPILLPKDTKVTRFIIMQHHQRNSHAGPEITFRNIRQLFWLLGGKSQVRKCIRLCPHNLCKYPNIQEQTQLMANLPEARIQPGNFQSVSLDFCGPFQMKQCGICQNQTKCISCTKKAQPNKSIKCTIKKCWIVVFACHASRAVHLELLLDKTTESFLLSVKRFCNRRGTPSLIQSDNATEILKGRNIIKDVFEKLNNSRTHQKLAEEFQIKWYTCPVYSPSKNG